MADHLRHHKRHRLVGKSNRGNAARWSRYYVSQIAARAEVLQMYGESLATVTALEFTKNLSLVRGIVCRGGRLVLAMWPASRCTAISCATTVAAARETWGVRNRPACKRLAFDPVVAAARETWGVRNQIRGSTMVSPIQLQRPAKRGACATGQVDTKLSAIKPLQRPAKRGACATTSAQISSVVCGSLQRPAKRGACATTDRSSNERKNHVVINSSAAQAARTKARIFVLVRIVRTLRNTFHRAARLREYLRGRKVRG